MKIRPNIKKKLLSNAQVEELKKIIALYEKPQAALLPILHEVQRWVGWISRDLEAEIAELLKIPEVKVREVVSFYLMFHEKPVGKYHIKVCQTLACHLMGYTSVLDHIKNKFQIGLNETTEDGKFTLSVVECLGACHIAPVMQINDEIYGELTPEKVDQILGGLS